MSDLESVLTPSTPNARSISELRSNYIARAKRNSSLISSHGNAPYTASAKTFGTEWGVGVGLYFELLRWLRWLALLLMFCAIPFLVVVGCSVFTDAAHMHDHGYGVKKYPATKVHSLTFAAIVDDSVDNGTLQYMNTVIAKSWNGPMRKSSFLIWISMVDAGSALLFLLGLAVLWYHLQRFARVTDKDTLEAADYTVLVRGLPQDADAAQIGEHFSRYGEVMDVALVTDRLSATLRHCGRAAQLQQRRTMVLDASKVRQTAKYAAMMDKLDQRLAGIAEKIRGVAERHQRVKAAFVTFNSENERRTCEAQCPKSWLGSLMQRRQDRFQAKHSFWVRQASAPEDYKFEDLAVSEWQLFAREATINIAMLLLVVVCAAAIAKLTDISNQQSATLSWHKDRLVADSAASMVLLATNGSLTLDLDATAVAAGDMFGGELFPQLEAFCGRQLRDACTARLQDKYDGLVSVSYGAGLKWVNATSRLLYERAVEEELLCSTRTVRTSGGCGLQGCLPCLCMGVQRAGLGSSLAVAANASDSDVESVCSPYINMLDIRTWGIRLSISAVVAVLNSAIKWVLAWLVLHGRHWTHTARERSFALQCFVAMLVNTVVVLLVTNSEALGRLARESGAGSWTRFFVRYGSYSDFTPDWYENVGLSILILMIINVGSPLLNLAIEELLLMGRRCCVLYCVSWPLQSDYNTAWARPRFTLAQRTADLLLNVSLALLFGSGIPLLYLVLAVYVLVAELADRWALTRLCCGAPRYNTGLMKLVMELLPWLVAAHCAFGVWMHTYFRVVLFSDSGSSGGLEEVSQLSVAVANGRLTATGSDLAALQHSSVWQRITQPNGLALLLLLIGLVLALLVGRFVVWKVLSCLVCVGRVCCVRRGARLMRFELRRDTEQQVNAVSYAEALVTRQLHGTPTYRLAHHPHYLQYFAASGLNRAMGGVAALVMSAANGGARSRSVYTRLTTVQRRGRLPVGSTAFRVLPTPVVDREVLPGDDVAAFGRRCGLPSITLDDGAHYHQHPGDATGQEEEGVLLVSMPPVPRMSKPLGQGQGADGQGGRGGAQEAAAGGVITRAPDVVELLQEEQIRASISSVALGPVSPPWQAGEQQQPGDSPRTTAARTPTAAAIVNILTAASPARGAGGGASRAQSGASMMITAAAAPASAPASVDGGAGADREAAAALAAGALRVPSQLEGSPVARTGTPRPGGAGAEGMPPGSPLRYPRIHIPVDGAGPVVGVVVGPATEGRSPARSATGTGVDSGTGERLRPLSTRSAAPGAAGEAAQPYSAQPSPASTPRAGAQA